MGVSDCLFVVILCNFELNFTILSRSVLEITAHNVLGKFCVFQARTFNAERYIHGEYHVSSLFIVFPHCRLQLKVTDRRIKN